jgi:2-methylisocitrate lyase-like PEP mutase family enzyme
MAVVETDRYVGPMLTQTEKAQRFAELHQSDAAFVIPNPFDAGSAKVLASLGFAALATTSSGFAGTLGRLDGQITRDEALEHAAAIVEATELPVSADLENAFADDPSDVAETIALAAETGLAGCSVEDYSGRANDDIYDAGLAAERVAAATEAAHAGPVRLVLTARAENHIHGRDDLGDTIARLQSFQEAGADVLYAPGLIRLDDIRQVVQSVDRPVNVLMLPGGPTVGELNSVGVKRVSLGGALSAIATGALYEAAREVLEQGTHNFWNLAGAGRTATRTAYEPS